MASVVTISVEGISKVYRLGQIGGHTLSEDLNRWLAQMRGMPDPYLKIGHEQRRRREGERIWALSDVSFAVQQGEVLGVIGRNGAGKSTLLKILSRITAPTAGRVRLKGRVASLLEVGTGFHPELTGRENVFLNGAILGMTRQELRRKLDNIVEFAEVARFIDTPVKRYSSGMYVRLAFAVAAHLDPEILVVDEVLAVGDAAFQKKCIGKMGEVAEGGRTVIFVSHNMTAVHALCERTLVLEAGQVAFTGTTASAVDRYLKQGLPDTAGVVLERYRQAKRTAVVSALRVLDGAGCPRRLFEIGSSVVLELTLQACAAAFTPQVTVTVSDSFGLRLFTVSTSATDTVFPILRGEATVRAVLENLMLVPGAYFASIKVGDGYRSADILDQVPVFEILPSDYWESGRLPSRDEGVVLQDVSWSYEEAPPRG